MEKNVIIAVVLSTLILLVWFRINPTPPAQNQPFTRGQVMTSEPREESRAVMEEESAKSRTTRAGGTREKGKTITVQTAEDIIELTSRGAGIKHWYIKERHKEKENMPDLIFMKEVDIIPLQVSARNIEDISDVMFKVGKSPGRTDGRIVLNEGENARIQFDYLTNSGIKISKIYDFSYSGGMHNFKLKITNKSKNVQELKNLSVLWNSGLGIIGEGITSREKKLSESLNKENYMNMKVLSFVDGRLRRKLKDGIVSPAIDWTGIGNRYFVSALINRDKDFSRIIINKYETGKRGKKVPQTGLGAEAFSLNPGESKTFNIDLFVGIKDSDKMKVLGINLEKIINYGFFDPISKLFMVMLKFFYKLTRNYGIAIILLTCVLHLLTFPLSRKSLKATQKMKELQPQMKEMQAKYKDDPKRLNAETMNFYKSKKANPLGGCLPMIFQIPIFFSLFRMLQGATALRYEGFLWVIDLSMKDPYYVFPVLMGVSMFFQQRISSPGGDPAQQKMMMFMPVFFTFIFLKFPAGLTLYWLTNNILTLTQHLIMSMKEKKKRELVVP